MRQCRKHETGRGFTLIELLVVIAIIAILAAILFPVFMAAKERGRAACCLNNMMQLGKGFRMYLDEWGGRFPGAAPYTDLKAGMKNRGHWVRLIWQGGTNSVPPKAVEVRDGAIYKYVKSPKLYICPSDENNRVTNFGLSYSMNCYLAWRDDDRLRLFESQVRQPSKTVLLVDEANGHSVNGVPHPINDGYFGGYPGGDTPTSVHAGGANFTYCDGHARWVSRDGYLDQLFDPSVYK